MLTDGGAWLSVASARARSTREPHGEDCAVTFAVTLGLDRSTVKLHQSADQCDGDPKASLRSVDRDIRLDKQVENIREHIGSDADPFVRDPQRGVLPLHRHRHADPPLRRSELERIGTRLPTICSRRTGRHSPTRIRRRPRPCARPAGSMSSRRRSANGLCEVDRLSVQRDLPRHHTTHIEEVVHEACHAEDLTFNDGARPNGARLSNLSEAQPAPHPRSPPGDCAARGPASRETHPWTGFRAGPWSAWSGP